MFWECKKKDGKAISVTTWGTKVSTKEKLDDMLQRGYHELECGKSSAYACKAKPTTGTISHNDHALQRLFSDQDNTGNSVVGCCLHYPSLCSETKNKGA